MVRENRAFCRWILHKEDDHHDNVDFDDDLTCLVKGRCPLKSWTADAQAGAGGGDRSPGARFGAIPGAILVPGAIPGAEVNQ